MPSIVIRVWHVTRLNLHNIHCYGRLPWIENNNLVLNCKTTQYVASYMIKIRMSRFGSNEEFMKNEAFLIIIWPVEKLDWRWPLIIITNLENQDNICNRTPRHSQGQFAVILKRCNGKTKWKVSQQCDESPIHLFNKGRDSWLNDWSPLSTWNSCPL